LLDRRLHHRQKRVGEFFDVFAGNDGPDALMRQRARPVDAEDFGMRMRRADDVSVQGSDRDRKIVGIAAAARQERRVFLAQDGLAELSRHDFMHASLILLSTSAARCCQYTRQ
jgi:hypothetical protein